MPGDEVTGSRSWIGCSLVGAIYAWGIVFLLCALDEARVAATSKDYFALFPESVVGYYSGDPRLVVRACMFQAALMAAALAAFRLRRKAWLLGPIGIIGMIELQLCAGTPAS
jgi:hypothetical protein